MTTPFDVAAEAVATGADALAAARALVAALTLDEKLGCLDGDTPFWPGLTAMMSGGYNTQAWPAAVVERVGIPGLHFIDGPRGCVVGPSTTFPAAMARGASFDPALEERIGVAIGAELRAAGANFTGSPCMNLLRHPAWGRAQETYGEDPHHVGEMAAAMVRGLQRHVMACAKHFALNSMENARFQVDVLADERTLHEVYLPHFRRVCAEGVASIMSAYNSVNGEWCGQDRVLLYDILRSEWGWDGFVITDFIAGLRDPVLSVQGGCNVEMPFAQQRAEHLAGAIADGRLDEADVDERVVETVATFLRFAAIIGGAAPTVEVAGPTHRALAKEAATASAVLLRNEGSLLPVAATDLRHVAVLGRLATQVNLGDRGSSDVRYTPDPVTLLDGIQRALADAEVTHSADNASIAAGADLAVVVVGYTHLDEGEYIGSGLDEVLANHAPAMDHPTLGFGAGGSLSELAAASEERTTVGGGATDIGGDRASLRLLPADEDLIAAAADVSDRVVVVVVAGSAVMMPWLESVPAVLHHWYAGSEAGTALAELLTGAAEPGGRLPFAVPADERHLVPFDRHAESFTYDLLHGQWWLDAQGHDAEVPFGFGLGYTTFALEAAHLVEGDVVAGVVNTGDRAGSTVVQVYGSIPASEYQRPARRLVGFAKVHVAPGEHRDVRIPVDTAQLDVRVDGRWVTEDLPVQFEVGFHAADVALVAQ